MTITTYQAAKLAFSFNDAMRMVREKSAFHLPVDTTPRAALDNYLKSCKDCGVSLHNEHWLSEAESVVEELTANRRAALKKLFNRA